MITLILSLLGGGGILGAAAWFFMPGAKELIGGVIKAIPRPVWYALIAALALWLGWQWHQSEKRAAWKDGFAEGEEQADTEWQRAFAKMEGAAGQWRENFEKQSDKLSDARKQAHEQDLRRNAAAADALSLRGPGKAAFSCPIGGAAAGLAPTPGGPGATPASPDAPPGRVPAEDGPNQFAIVPWNWLVERARDHDDLLSEASAWRAHDGEQQELWNDRREELRKALEAARPGF